MGLLESIVEKQPHTILTDNIRTRCLSALQKANFPHINFPINISAMIYGGAKIKFEIRNLTSNLMKYHYFTIFCRGVGGVRFGPGGCPRGPLALLNEVLCISSAEQEVY